MRVRNVLTIAAALSACAFAACGGRSGEAFAPAGGAGAQVPAFAIERVVFPDKTIGEELPSEGVGSTKDPTWGKIGGFTQSGKAQVLAFPPKTKITIRNLSSSIQHTLDWVADASKPPAKFPANPSLSFSKKGDGKFGAGYASGIINPGKSVTVVLDKAGTYLIGCAFHYNEGMRDVIRVEAGATPGPTHK